MFYKYNLREYGWTLAEPEARNGKETEKIENRKRDREKRNLKLEMRKETESGQADAAHGDVSLIPTTSSVLGSCADL